MKFHHRWPWCEWFGDELSKAITTASDASSVNQTNALRSDALTVVCAVPMHPFRRFQRGFNQSHLIAKRIARVQGWPLAPLLSRSRYTPAQTAIAPSQRGPNVAGSFVMRSNVDLSGATVWLIDDVKTSGSTLVNCARLLRKAGAESVRVAVVAVADPKHADFTQT
jgi:ComF family protein